MKTMITGSNAITDATIEGKKKKQLSYQMTKERVESGVDNVQSCLDHFSEGQRRSTGIQFEEGEGRRSEPRHGHSNA